MPTPEQSCYRHNPAGVLVCDLCGKDVPPNSNGLISWTEDTAGNVSSFRLTCNRKGCDKDHQQPKSSQLDYVNLLGFGYVTDVAALSKWPGDALTRLLFITWAVTELNKAPQTEGA